MSVETVSPAATYLTKTNIVYPGSAAQATADEAAARAEIAARKNVASVTGGAIKR
jgi:hypothetical protein